MKFKREDSCDSSGALRSDAESKASASYGTFFILSVKNIKLVATDNVLGLHLPLAQVEK